MKQGWEIKKLGEIAAIAYGYTQKASFADIGPKFLRITDIQDDGVNWDIVPYCKITEEEFQKYRLNKDDIVFARTGATTGKSYHVINPPKSVYASYLIKVRVNYPELSPGFLFLYFQTKTYWDKISDGVSGSAQGGFNATKLSALEIPIPSLPEQRRIVSILDEAFDVITKAKANAAQNLKNARELFDSYLQNVFKKRGNGWEQKRFDETCVLQRGFDLPTHSRFEGKYPLVSSNGITDRIKEWKVKAPGVVTGRSGTIGNVHFIEEDFWPLNTALYIRDFCGNYERFVYYFLLYFDLKKYSSGAGVPTLNRNNVHSELVWFPKSILEQQTIVRHLDDLRAETKKLETLYQQKLNDLDELKKAILQKAFNGELIPEKAIDV